MTSPRAPEIGLPTLRLSSWASSSSCCLTSALYFWSVRPRFAADQLDQPFGSSSALRAAATALSTSGLPPSGAVAMTLPVAGLTISNVWPSEASTCSPPMIIFARRMSSVAVSAGVFCSIVMAVLAMAPELGADDTPDLADVRWARASIKMAAWTRLKPS